MRKAVGIFLGDFDSCGDALAQAQKPESKTVRDKGRAALRRQRAARW